MSHRNRIAGVACVLLALVPTSALGQSTATTDFATGLGRVGLSSSGANAKVAEGNPPVVRSGYPVVPMGVRSRGRLPFDTLGSFAVLGGLHRERVLYLIARAGFAADFGRLRLGVGLQAALCPMCTTSVALAPASVSARWTGGALSWVAQLRDSLYAPSPEDVVFLGFDLGNASSLTRIVAGFAAFEPIGEGSRFRGARVEVVRWWRDIHFGVAARVGHGDIGSFGSVQVVAGFDSEGTTARPRPDPTRPRTRVIVTPPAREARVSLPGVADVLRAGRVFSQRLGTLRSDLPAPPVVSNGCIVDEQVVAAGVLWSHLSCTPELPATAPTHWRSGCYVTRPSGIWRLARCPSEDDHAPDLPELIIPARSPDASWRFPVWHGGRLVRREVGMGVGRVMAVCQELDTDRPEERCFVDGVGLVWSARRWSIYAGPRRPKDPPRPPERAVQIKVVATGPLRAPRHLKFREASSASCEVLPACHELGLCRRRGGACVATDAADCRAARVCRAFGRCTPLAGACVATRVEDCARSSDCRAKGRCALRGRRCVAPKKGGEERP